MNTGLGFTNYIDVNLIAETAILSNNSAVYSSFNKIPEHYFKLNPSTLKDDAHPTQIEKYLVSTFTANLFKILISKDAKAFKTKHLAGRVCSYNHLYYRVLQNPAKLLWLLHSVTSSPHIVEEYLPVYEEYLSSRGTSFELQSVRANIQTNRIDLRLHNLIKNILQK